MKNYDVIIIGGGMMGTSCAYYLCKEGLKVLLIERGDIAGGTVSHTDGSIGYAEKKPGVDVLQGYHSLRLYDEMARTFDYNFEYHTNENGDTVGYVYFCESEFEMEKAAERAKEVQAQGMEMYLVDSKELKELEPNGADDLMGGLWIPNDGVVCPYRVAFGFIYEANKTGNLDVLKQTEVVNILQDPNTKAVKGVLTDKGNTYYSPKIVNAAGVWAPFIGAMVGMEVPIEPRYGQLLVSEKAQKVTQNREVLEYGYILTKFFADGERPISDLVKAYNFCLNIETTLSGNTIVGGCRLFRGYSIRSEYRIMQAIAQRGVRFFPMLKDMMCIRSFAGLRPFCLDHLPIVSDVEEVPGMYMACGHEGDGIALGPITGKLIPQYVTEKPLQFPEATELAWSRFKKVDIQALKARENENTRQLQELERKYNMESELNSHCQKIRS